MKIHDHKTMNVPGFRATPIQDKKSGERREIKFLINHVDPLMIDDILRVNAKAVSDGEQKISWVSSIYFDDEQASSCLETLAGVGTRTKVRLRWYDAPFSKVAFFELKQRENLTMRKQRFRLNFDRPIDQMSYAELIASLIEALPDEAASWLKLRSVPTVLISYRRHRYRDRDSHLRVTLDYDMQVSNQYDAISPTRRFSIALAEPSVIEVKDTADERDRIPRLLHPLTPRVTRFSKYLTGYNRVVDHPFEKIL
jgi:hypothetical protein